MKNGLKKFFPTVCGVIKDRLRLLRKATKRIVNNWYVFRSPSKYIEKISNNEDTVFEKRKELSEKLRNQLKDTELGELKELKRFYEFKKEIWEKDIRNSGELAALMISLVAVLVSLSTDIFDDVPLNMDSYRVIASLLVLLLLLAIMSGIILIERGFYRKNAEKVMITIAVLDELIEEKSKEGPFKS